MKKLSFKILAVLFGFLSLGGLLESFRIITSDDFDIASQRGRLIVMSLVMLGVMLILTRYFWIKSKS